MNIIPISLIVKYSLKALDNIEYGTLHLVTPEGKIITARGTKEGPQVTWKLNSWEVVRRLLKHGDIALGEDYIAGNWEADSVENLLKFFLLNYKNFEKFSNGGWLSRSFFGLYNRLIKRNSKTGSRKNIHAHYDVGNDFYKLWLDKTMTYSSALFNESDNQTLEDAQSAKYRRILERVGNKGQHVLEIGCGWGGFAAEASKQNTQVTGLTISQQQFQYATDRVKDSSNNIKLQDYRDIKGTFDAIVSIEMFEAVGERYWPEYFNTIAARLKKGGKAIVQTITMGDEDFEDYRKRSDFIRHYVFPGGMLPSMARFNEEATKAGLKCVEVFSFGQDYARTLREWRVNFDAHKKEIKAMGYNDAFIRNWRFYLELCAATFAVGRTNVVQVELVHA